MSVGASSGPRKPEDFVAELRDLISAHLAGNAQLLGRVNEFINHVSDRLASGDLKRPVDASELFSKWLEFNLASYSIVSAQGLGLLNGIVSAAERTFIGDAPAPPGDAGPTPVELHLTGRPGERTASAFLIENHFDHPLSVSFESSDLVPAQGPALPGSHVTFEPARLALPPRQQAVVQTAVAITPSFIAGETYQATVRVLGLSPRALSLTLVIQHPDEAQPPAKTTAGRGSRRKRSPRKGSR